MGDPENLNPAEEGHTNGATNPPPPDSPDALRDPGNFNTAPVISPSGQKPSEPASSIDPEQAKAMDQVLHSDVSPALPQIWLTLLTFV